MHPVAAWRPLDDRRLIQPSPWPHFRELRDSRRVTRKCHWGALGFAVSRFAQENPPRIENGLRIRPLIETVEIPQANGGSVMAGRQGVLRPALRNLNKRPAFEDNSHGVSELAFSDSFVGSGRLASAFGFCQCEDTRNDTRAERLRSSSHREHQRLGIASVARI